MTNYDNESQYHNLVKHILMKKQLIFLTIWGIFIFVSVNAVAESNPFSVSRYGVIHYSHFDWELDPGRCAATETYQPLPEEVELSPRVALSVFGLGLLEAILWHGGEAERSRQIVEQMSKVERDAPIAFLESL